MDKKLKKILEDLKKEYIEEVEEIITQYENKNKKVQKPDNGEYYYYINHYGEVYCVLWFDNDIDNESLSIGNIFKTREEAQFMIEKLKVIHELETLGRPFKYGRDNYYIALDEENNKILFYHNYKHQSKYCNCYFDNEEEAQQAIEEIGEDRIKKYLFK